MDRAGGGTLVMRRCCEGIAFDGIEERFLGFASRRFAQKQRRGTLRSE